MKKVFHIILAGGGGTRLWPLSTSRRPKQFVNIEGNDTTLLESTICRIQASGEPNTQIILSTNDRYYDQVTAITEKYGIQHVIKEPAKRNTAPAHALAVHYALSHCDAHEDDVVVFSNSDHVISPIDDFLTTLYRGIDTASENDGLVIYGIRPTRPDTGYGYIEVDDPQAEVCRVLHFREKPNAQMAIDYLSGGKYFWNSGIYVGRIGVYVQNFREFSPAIGQIFDWPYETVLEKFSDLPDVQVDVAIAERSSKILCVPMDVTWSDVGSWDRISEVRAVDENGNLLEGKVYAGNALDNLVWIENRRKLVVLHDVKDLVVIDTVNALYITSKGSEGKIKKLLADLKEKHFGDFL